MPPLEQYLRRDLLLLRSSVTRERCCPAAARPSRVPQARPVGRGRPVPVAVLALAAVRAAVVVPAVVLVRPAVLPLKARPVPSVPAARLPRELRSPLQVDPGQSRRAALALQPSPRVPRPCRPRLARRS